MEYYNKNNMNDLVLKKFNRSRLLMNDLIKKILIEWSFRLDDGMINLHNPKHMIVLSEF